jgi:hypothetical protein
MTKPLTVEHALRNLTESIVTKTVPAEVVIVEPKLKGRAQALQFWLSVAIIFQIRTAIVWAAFAILAPQFGVTWFMVMVGLYAIRHLRPTDLKALIKSIASK